MLEWLKRHAWKACNRQKRFASSNLAHSALISRTGTSYDGLVPVLFFRGECGSEQGFAPGYDCIGHCVAVETPFFGLDADIDEAGGF